MSNVERRTSNVFRNFVHFLPGGCKSFLGKKADIFELFNCLPSAKGRRELNITTTGVIFHGKSDVRWIIFSNIQICGFVCTKKKFGRVFCQDLEDITFFGRLQQIAEGFVLQIHLLSGLYGSGSRKYDAGIADQGTDAARRALMQRRGHMGQAHYGASQSRPTETKKIKSLRDLISFWLYCCFF